MKMSILEKERLNYKPELPEILKDPLSIEIKEEESRVEIEDSLKKLFKNSYRKKNISFLKGSKRPQALRVGVFFSGGQASGGHNVIWGLFDALKKIDKKSSLFGFLNGPDGVIDGKYEEIREDKLKDYRNMGGFDLLGSSRTKIETDEQKKKALDVVSKLDLDGLVVIGGDDSNTNAAILSEYFISTDCKTAICGVPKTIDGDLKNEYIATSFGFDTACKVYSEMIGNIQRDAISAKKYYHFIKLMGRSASHIALECALKTNPNYCIIAEEVKRNNRSLDEIVSTLAELIVKRAKGGKNYGVFLIPEGLIEFIPEIKRLIGELNSVLADNPKGSKGSVLSSLTAESKETFSSLPSKIQDQLLLDRDPHGNVQVSKIETEKLLIDLINKKLKNMKGYKSKFNALSHFFGYEGRAAMPSNFDADYCYSLGYVAAVLLMNRLTGYICAICGLEGDDWRPMGISLVSLMNIEKRKGVDKPVIRKALVDLSSKAFKDFLERRALLKEGDLYMSPGPIQYAGVSASSHPITID